MRRRRDTRGQCPQVERRTLPNRRHHGLQSPTDRDEPRPDLFLQGATIRFPRPPCVDPLRFVTEHFKPELLFRDFLILFFDLFDQLLDLLVALSHSLLIEIQVVRELDNLLLDF